MSDQSARTVVIGSGLAGLTCALALAPRPVTLITKTPELVGGSSNLAQGGIAAAIGPGDSAEAHARDTLAAGAGLCDVERVLALTQEGGEALKWLEREGICFDRDTEGRLQLAREGAHRLARVVHAGGDATGSVVMRSLAQRVVESPSISVATNTFASDLLLQHGRIAGVSAFNERAGWHNIHSPHVVLATGGIGMVWEHTTNPVESTGDGLAMAARAGAVLDNVEFLQFHPTAMAARASDSNNLTLLTEALRGAGATLLDESGNRFMLDEHRLAELAPRDVVARAIHARIMSGERVFLDIKPALENKGKEAFPGAITAAENAGLDPYLDPIPVLPAAHYHMGGVKADSLGRSSIEGLWVCGEVAASGVHGANRLASNSLLEAVAYARRVASDVLQAPDVKVRSKPSIEAKHPNRLGDSDRRELVRKVRHLMTQHVGIVRNGPELGSTLQSLDSLDRQVGSEPGEVSNILFVARLVTFAALRRTESRGSHFRQDFPKAISAWQRSQSFAVGASLPY